MLLRFRVANYRSIRDEQELSFVATDFNEGTGAQVEVRPSGTTRVLPVIGVYGANASGKSNVLNALAHLSVLGGGLLRASYERGGSGLGPPRVGRGDPRPTHPVRDRVLAEGVRYVYGLHFTDRAVHREWLHAYPQGRRQVWFERDPASPDRLRFPDNHLGSTQSTLAELARPDRPFISLANEVRQPQLAPVADWFDGMRALSAPGRSGRLTSEYLVPLFSGEHSDRVIEMIRRADPGIDGAEIVDVEPSERATAFVSGADVRFGCAIAGAPRQRHWRFAWSRMGRKRGCGSFFRFCTRWRTAVCLSSTNSTAVSIRNWRPR
jgi:hypothetical protein